MGHEGWSSQLLFAEVCMVAQMIESGDILVRCLQPFHVGQSTLRSGELKSGHTSLFRRKPMHPEEQNPAPTPEAQIEEQKSSVFRQDGGSGSVRRERQPGFGGMDARPAVEGEENWQNITSDRYGHPISPEELVSEEIEIVEVEKADE